MKKNAAFLYDLFRPDPVPVDDEADLAVVAAVDPSEVIPPEADATKADDHVPDEEWRFPWETEPLESESQPSLADVDGVTWVHRPDHAERYGWEPVGVPSKIVGGPGADSMIFLFRPRT